MMLADINNIQSKLDDTVRELRDSYTTKGIKASGKWGDSLETYIEESDNSIKVGIKALDYIQYPEYGRGANKVQSVEAAKKLYPIILKWASVKGINVSNINAFAFRTALKLVYKGYTVPNAHNPGGVISDVINESWIKEMIGVVGGDYIKNFESSIIRSLKLI